MYAIVKSGAVSGPFTPQQVCSQLHMGFDPNEAGDLSVHGVYPYPAIPDPVPGEVIDVVTLLFDGHEVTASVSYRPLEAEELEEKRAERQQALNDRFDQHMLAGWTHDFGEGVGIHTLDNRPGRDDKSNWTLFLFETGELVAAGYGATPCEITTAANETISVPASEANAAMRQMLTWGRQSLSRKWAIRDEIKAATTYAAIMAVDIDADWPQ